MIFAVASKDINREILCDLQSPNSRKDPLGSTSSSGLKNGHNLVSTGKMSGEEQAVGIMDVRTASNEKEQTNKQLSEEQKALQILLFMIHMLLPVS